MGSLPVPLKVSRREKKKMGNLWPCGRVGWGGGRAGRGLVSTGLWWYHCPSQVPSIGEHSY